MPKRAIARSRKARGEASANGLAATARELQVMGEQMRTGKNLSPIEIEARSRKAGEKARREIKERLGPKE